MLNNTQNVSTVVDTPVKSDVKCHYCKGEMVQLTKNAALPSFVCANCGGCLIIEAKRSTCYDGNHGMIYNDPTRLVWKKIKVDIESEV